MTAPPAMPDDERFASGERIRREILGDERVNAVLARSTAFDAPFQDLVTRYAWGTVWARDGLDRATRSAITLAMLATLGRERELALHVQVARSNGLSTDEISEVLLHVALYAGVPAAHAAFDVARRVLEESGDLG